MLIAIRRTPVPRWPLVPDACLQPGAPTSFAIRAPFYSRNLFQFQNNEPFAANGSPRSISRNALFRNAPRMRVRSKADLLLGSICSRNQRN